MKKFNRSIILLLLSCLIFVACSKKEENIETKKESVVSPELEIKLINQKIDNYFDKIDKLELRRKELEKRIFIKED